MRAIRRFALLLPLLAACGTGPLDPGPFSLDGAWLGRAYPYELSFGLEQDGENRVRGTGELRGLQEVLETATNPNDPADLDTLSIDTVVTGTVQFDVAGEWNHPTFTLQLTREGYAGAVYEGTYTAADSIRGNLRGSGFTNPAIPIVRQPAGS